MKGKPVTTCRYCRQDIPVADSCFWTKFQIGEEEHRRIPFAAQGVYPDEARCSLCGVVKHGYHHPGCDVEICPCCFGQATTCACEDSDDTGTYADVRSTIESTAVIIREGPPHDSLFIDPVAGCGHMGKGHVRTMIRKEPFAFEEWFKLGLWMGEETAAVLFICQSHDGVDVDDQDLGVARSFYRYADSISYVPWDLIFLTATDLHSAAQMLGWPGLPSFAPCTHERRQRKASTRPQDLFGRPVFQSR